MTKYYTNLIELLIDYYAACQGLDLVRPLTTTKPLEAVHALVRGAGVKPWDGDRFMSPDIDAVAELVRNGEVARAVRAATDTAEVDV